jgi:hypothetical protein
LDQINAISTIFRFANDHHDNMNRFARRYAALDFVKPNLQRHVRLVLFRRTTRFPSLAFKLAQHRILPLDDHRNVHYVVHINTDGDWFMTYQQTERLNETYTVTRYAEHLRGVMLAVYAEEADKLWSKMAHSAEPAADVDDYWHSH